MAGAVLFLIALGGAALATLPLRGNALQSAISLAVDPQQLLLVAVAAGGVALLWAGLIVLTHWELRRYATLDAVQRTFGGVVVLTLIVGVSIPAYTVGHSALIQRGLINAVFAENGDAEAGAGTGPNAENSLVLPPTPPTRRRVAAMTGDGRNQSAAWRSMRGPVVTREGDRAGKPPPTT